MGGGSYGGSRGGGAPQFYDFAVFPADGLYSLVDANGTVADRGGNVSALLAEAISVLKGRGGIVFVKGVEVRDVPSLPENVAVIVSHAGSLWVYGSTSVDPWRFQPDHTTRLPRPPERLISDFENASSLLRSLVRA
jgi:hypothetical protein